MIINNPDEQVWRMLTGGAGSTAGRKELDQLKRLLTEQKIFFVVDHDDRYHWIRLRSRRDLQIIQIKADVLEDAGELEISYGGQKVAAASAAEALSVILGYYR